MPKIFIQKTQYGDYRAWSEDNPYALYIGPLRSSAIGKLIAATPKKFGLEIEDSIEQTPSPQTVETLAPEGWRSV